MAKYKYHYVFYIYDEFLGVLRVLDTAQDSFMLWALKQKYSLLRNLITIKKQRITKAEWKARYC